MEVEILLRSPAKGRPIPGTATSSDAPHNGRSSSAGRTVRARRSAREKSFNDLWEWQNAAAHAARRGVADLARPTHPEFAEAMDEAENDVLAYMDFPSAHRSKLHSTNGVERLNKEVKRRADVVGIFPNEASIIRLVGAILMEANDEWQLQHRYLSVEALAEVAAGDDGDKYTLAPPAAAPILTPRAA